MKNLFKVFGIIALAAVIGFSFAACSDGGGGGGSGGGGGGGSSSLAGTNWSHQNDFYTLSFTASQYTMKCVGVKFASDTYEFDAKSGKGTLFKVYDDGSNEPFTVNGKNLTYGDGEHAWVFTKK